MKALVTGASSGIGEEIAKELGKRGYDIILVARNEEKLKDVASKIKTKTRIITMDLSNKENCKKLYEETKNEDIDILINNAGFGVHGKFCDTDLNKEVQMIETNITAVHILMKLYLKDMIKKDRGHILNVASMAAFGPGPLMISYYASKAYVLNLTEAIYEECKDSGIRISCLCPGPVKTTFQDKAGIKKSESAKKYLMDAEEVAKVSYKDFKKGKLIIIPGMKNKLLVIGNKLLPRRISRKIILKTNKK